MASIEELQAKLSFTTGGKTVTGGVTFLPEPAWRSRRYVVIFADDNAVEPPHTFEGRLPAALADRGPHVVEKDGGTHVWVFDGQEIPNVGFNAVVGGRSVKTASNRPSSMRCARAPGTSTRGSGTWTSTAFTPR